MWESGSSIIDVPSINNKSINLLAKKFQWLVLFFNFDSCLFKLRRPFDVTPNYSELPFCNPAILFMMLLGD